MSHKTEIPATVAASTQCVDGNYSEIPKNRAPNVRFRSRLGHVNIGHFLGQEVGAAAEQLRHYCRNPRCRSKLSTPVENLREAFCTRGCHTQFYRKHCIACEQPMERKRESQQLCGRRRCKNHFAALKAHFSLGRYHPSSSALDASGNPIKTGIFSPLKSDREWRLVAGPAVDMRLATIGAAGAVKQADKANRRHWAEAGAAALIQRHHAPDNVVGGYKFADAPEIEIAPSGNVSTSTPISGPVITDGDALDIPEFLKRPLPEVPA